MRQVFAKRFWGFDPQRWPIISFGLAASRDSLIRSSRAGDVIAFVGTQQEPTALGDRGRFLGLAEIGRLPIDSLDVLDTTTLQPESFASDGKFKWPKALPMLRAWKFPDRPKVTEVIKAQLSYGATVRAVLLDADDRAAVLELPREEVDVPDLELIRRHRALADALSSSGPTKGPAPSSWSGEVSRNMSGAAVTYALRFGRRNIWKIGHAQDVAARLAEVNKHVPHETLGESWTAVLTQRWKTQMAAYDMEQRVLALLNDKRTQGERVVCTASELQAAWVDAMIPGQLPAR